MRTSRFFLSVLMIFALGCTGDTGPMGPQGEQGIQGVQGLPGPAGVGTRVVLTATVGSSGSASVALPFEAGTEANDPPALSCYHGMGTGTWNSVNDGWSLTTSAYCGLVFDEDEGRFYAAMLQSWPGWIAAFVVVY